MYNFLSNYADLFESKRATTKNCAGTTVKIRVCGNTLREKNWEKIKDISLGVELESTTGE